VRYLTKLFLFAVCASAMIACNRQGSDKISIISREEGSGTRSAFVELFDVLDANKNDITTINAEITNNTAVMISSVETNKRAIGYISMGSLSNVVKAAKINGVEATAENVKNGTYEISRPFLIATKDELSDLAQDFVNFIFSADGQLIVAKSGYIGTGAKEAFISAGFGGKIVVAGSSSVYPLMEKLKEAYLKINPNAAIEIQGSDSSTGVKAVESGICDIGMSSRNLRASEIEKGIKPTIIALDGIAVIINNNNSADNFTKEQVKSIFTGLTLDWSDIK
jgi:phosphate transport system substrate-binding protein